MIPSGIIDKNHKNHEFIPLYTSSSIHLVIFCLALNLTLLFNPLPVNVENMVSSK